MWCSWVSPPCECLVWSAGWSARGLVVGVRDGFAPDGLGFVAAVSFHQGQVGHEAAGRGAVPVLLPGSGVDRVAWVRLDDGAVAAAEQRGAVKDVQHLAETVGVPVRAGARREPHDRQAGLFRAGTGVDAVDPRVSGEGRDRPLGGRRAVKDLYGRYSSVIFFSSVAPVMPAGQPA